MKWSGGWEVCEILRANAGDSEFIRRGGSVHTASAEGDVAALPAYKGGDNGAVTGGVRVAGGGSGRRGRRSDKGRDAAAEGGGAEVQAAEGDASAAASWGDDDGS